MVGANENVSNTVVVETSQTQSVPQTSKQVPAISVAVIAVNNMGLNYHVLTNICILCQDPEPQCDWLPCVA